MTSTDSEQEALLAIERLTEVRFTKDDIIGEDPEALAEAFNFAGEAVAKLAKSRRGQSLMLSRALEKLKSTQTELASAQRANFAYHIGLFLFGASIATMVCMGVML